MKFLLALLTVFCATFILFASPRIADACSCMRPELSAQIENSDIVFMGIAKEKKAEEYVVSYSFEVERTFKGGPASNIIVKTATNSAACGANFTIGDSYVVYVRSDRGEHRTGLCAGNTVATDKLISSIEKEMELQGIEEPKVVTPVPATVTPKPVPPQPEHPQTPPPMAAGNPSCGGCSTSSSGNGLSVIFVFGLLVVAFRRRRHPLSQNS